MPRAACPVYPVKYLQGNELIKYMRDIYGRDMLETSYLFNRVTSEAYLTRVRGEHHNNERPHQGFGLRIPVAGYSGKRFIV